MSDGERLIELEYALLNEHVVEGKQVYRIRLFPITLAVPGHSITLQGLTNQHLRV